MLGNGIKVILTVGVGFLQSRNKIRSFFQYARELGFFFIGEFREDEVDVADFFAERVVPCAEAEAWEVFGAEVGDDGFEAVVAAGRAFLSFADGAEG